MGWEEDRYKENRDHIEYLIDEYKKPIDKAKKKKIRGTIKEFYGNNEEYENIVELLDKIDEEKDAEEKLKDIARKQLGLEGRDTRIFNILTLWDEVFNVFSFNNPQYSRACMHMVLGIILRNCRIRRAGVKTDPRISVLYIKPTHSGGSAGYDMVALVVEKLGLKVKMVTEGTDAALIGTWVKNEDGESIFEAGILDKSQSDLVYWPESSTIFQKNLPSHSMKTRNLIQMGLNPIDSRESKFEKYLAGKLVKCHVEASLLLVTFPPAEFDDEMLYAGTVQRFCFIPIALTIDGRMENIDVDISRYDEMKIDIDLKIEKLVMMLSDIKKRYGSKEYIFNMDSDAITKFKELEKKLGERFKKTDLRIQEHMGSMLSATVRKVSAIAMHAAAIKESNVITGEDIEYAIDDVISPQLDLIHTYLETRPEHTTHSRQQDEELIKVLSSCGSEPRTKKEFLKIIGKCLKLTSKTSIYKRFNSWTDQGLIIEDNDIIRIVK